MRTPTALRYNTSDNPKGCSDESLISQTVKNISVYEDSFTVGRLMKDDTTGIFGESDFPTPTGWVR
jgi:hypothetical protein